MPNQDRATELERGNHSHHIITETVGCVIRDYERGLTGGAKATACDPVRVIVPDKLWREVVKYMGRISQACQEDPPSPGSAPIDNFQFDVFLHGYKLYRVPRNAIHLFCAH